MKYRQTLQDGSGELYPTQWIENVEVFYNEFAGDFRDIIPHVQKTLNQEGLGKIAENLGIWKLLGDEILFVYEVKNSYEEISVIISAFHSVLASWSRNGKKINIKGAAWLGQFPLIDRVVSVLGLEDYIGPSIDCGFRIAKYSDKNKLVLSIDVVNII